MDVKPLPQAVSYINGELFILDQRKLPLTEEINIQKSVEDVWVSIKELKVRGAPAIGIAAGFGVLVGLKNLLHLPINKFKAQLVERANYLNSSRPTAVNLSNALNRMRDMWEKYGGNSTEELFYELEKEAILIYDEDVKICNDMGKHGKSLIKEGGRILTHCNAGALAASVMGTALAPVYAAHNEGVKFQVYADETRPLLQGARLTAWELQRAGVDVTLICDGMAAYLMSKGGVDLVIVGCDRVAANGDTANKIGTLGVAVAASRYKIPFYIACPPATYDCNTKTGDDIVIEERKPEEVTHFAGVQVAPIGIKVFNPSFDVTPAELITGFITNNGIVTEQFDINLPKIFAKG